MSDKTDAASRLLAAEVEYLRACGWIPSAVHGSNGVVVWHLPTEAVRVGQEEALRRQKKKDRDKNG